MVHGWRKIVAFLLLLVVVADVASGQLVLCTQPGGSSRIETTWQEQGCHRDADHGDHEQTVSLDPSACSDETLAAASVLPVLKRSGFSFSEFSLPSVLLTWLTIDLSQGHHPLTFTAAIDPDRPVRAAIDSVVLLI